jgi:hypothetical protein
VPGDVVKSTVKGTDGADDNAIVRFDTPLDTPTVESACDSASVVKKICAFGSITCSAGRLAKKPTP